MSDESKLLNALQTSLLALTHSGGGKAFTDVLISINRASPQTFYSMPVAILGLGSSSWDDENPELGTTTVYVDMWVNDLSTPAGTNQAVGERGLIDLRETIRNNASHFSSGPFMSAVSMVSSTEPSELQGSAGNTVWHMRIEFDVLRG